MRTIFGLALVAAVGLVAAGATRAEEEPEVGPNKGPVAEWGDEEYHLEVLPDAKTGAVTVYVYGNHEEMLKAKKKAIDTKSLILSLKTKPSKVVKLTAAPEKGDPAGKATKFVGKDDVFKQQMKWAGTISGRVGTKPYSGDFKQK